ncbi:MAG: hypothetical protein JO356_13400 [Acidobacteria bacterium]|nr:hypothetical protein [Acidobacteriota bacterium]
MNLELRILLIPLTLLAFVGVGARITYGQVPLEQVAQTEKSDKTSQASANDCSLLTSAMIQKVLGQSVTAKPEAQKAPPMYGGEWGWNCTYHVGYANHGGVEVQFSIYTEATAAKAKQDFDTYSVAAEQSKGKPSIGDSAYWVQASDTDLILYVLKGKVHFSLAVTRAKEKQLADLASEVAARI